MGESQFEAVWRMGAVVLGLALIVALLSAVGSAARPASEMPKHRVHAAAVCADYPNQAAAQHAADTRDADGDGVYCESLPCPCAGPGTAGRGGSGNAVAPTQLRGPAAGCVRIHHTANIT